jgi:Carbamoyl-phosphate synthase L chain, ATP binding domain
MKRILMVAEETERWGPARLPQPLAEAGLEIAVLCSEDNPLHHSSFVSRHFMLEPLKTTQNFGQSFGAAMAEWKPDLVLPCDEPVVAMLHNLLKNPRRAAKYLDDKAMACLKKSIGKLDKLDAMILKYETRVLAESFGIRVPKSKRVTSSGEAAAAAREIGFPVYLKKSFSWAGQGVVGCANEAEINTGYLSMSKKTPWYKQEIKRWIGRDWFPVNTSIEVQKAVPGTPVMYNAVTFEGKLLGGFFAKRECIRNINGPSTIVKLGDNLECKAAAEKLVAAMGISGFISFDFMICEKTGEAYLLECNPRPNQINHLGHHIGADLCRALSAAIHGHDVARCEITQDKVVPLFPQEWLFDEAAALELVDELDVPRKDPVLFEFMLDYGRKLGRSSETMRAAIGAV